MRALIPGLILVASVFPAVPAQPANEHGPTAESLAPYVGLYQAKSGAVTSVALFDPGDGENRLLLTDFKSGLIRVLSPVETNVFSAGPGLLLPSPIELQIRFQRRQANKVSDLVVGKDGAAEEPATSIAAGREEVTFKNGEISLAGTLLTPSAGRVHAAVVFLHGSGPLNRYSFGPFPDYFLSRGFTVLVYDKRGTGRSKGNLDSATLDDLAADGRAAVRFLKEREGINPRQIGLCGASQGGFLAAQVAAENPDVAFIVNLYGMYVPVWRQELYRAQAEMRAEQIPDAEIADGLAFVKKEFEVAKTGNGWADLSKLMSQGKEKKWWPFVTKSSSLEDLRGYWRTLYSYDPSVALAKVTCPVLALFGELDTSTPVAETIENMQRALQVAHNADFASKVFPKTGHGLLEVETGARSEIPKAKRFAPGMFDCMSDWLQKKQFTDYAARTQWSHTGWAGAPN